MCYGCVLTLCTQKVSRFIENAPLNLDVVLNVVCVFSRREDGFVTAVVGITKLVSTFFYSSRGKVKTKSDIDD